MTNEFGIRLDGNGYAPSIMERNRTSTPGGGGMYGSGGSCWLCGRSFGAKLDRHEPWGGLANRTKSKELGLWVSLCHWGCHEGPGSVHDDPALNRALRRRTQAQAMCVYGWDLDEWRRRFGKSEIGEGENPWEIPITGEARGEDSWKASGSTALLRKGGKAEPEGDKGFRVVDDGFELPF